MRAYISVGKLRFINGLQYRSAAFAGIATQFFWGFIIIMIYKAFFSQNDPLRMTSISLDQLVSYVWLQQAFITFIVLWFRDAEIFQLITTGNIAYELCRPCAIYEYWYVKLLATRLASALLRCFPILIAAFALPQPYRMENPPSFVSFALFAVTLCMGLLLLVSISMFIYISVFWTMSPVGSTLMIGAFGEFMAGLIIPVPLMPEWLQKIAYSLPFRWTADFPFRVYSGQIPAHDAAWGILVQLVWLVVLVTLGKMLMNKALRQVVVQGG
ncbi:ABC transporter permease [Cohnella kolymensis]|uniref:ABC transporter permease n=1 Tax=Cohnella kolymensis TaxID=1590652 RepID=A0ABR5A1X3_9BACL|nr:ABC transporter permease [Cohnella kolymensis]KIL35054.1 ABC transporter permease [Cohnella kolymensis]